MNPEYFLAQKTLLQISNKTFMPKEWLDSITPEETKLFASPYNDYPFLLMENLMSEIECVNFSKEVLEESEKKLIGLISKEDGIIEAKIDTDIRKTYSHTPSKILEMAYNDIFLAQKSRIEAYFNVAIVQSSVLQVLGYKKGYFYGRHSDNCSEIVDKDGEVVHYSLSAPHRKMTTVFFISEQCVNPNQYGEFSGGELVFDFVYDENRTPFILSPKRGMMIAFPSNPYFSHTVKEVLDGYRISLVQWHDCVVL